MSWLFSQALVEEYLGDTCSAGEQSVQSSGNPTQQAYCAPDKMTAFSRISRFGMTYKPLTVDRGEELLMSYLAAFPVKTSLPQEKEQGLTESEAECGEKWRGWLAKYDPDSCSWRTAQCSLLEDSNECLETLPRSGMTRDGLLWELPMLAHHTSETGYGLWGTPTASQDMKPIRKLTPTEAAGTHGVILVGSIGRDHPNLIGRYLKPSVTEWMMGWPLGWTDLKPLETDKFQRWLDEHGSY